MRTSPGPDHVIADLAARQHGVVGRQQLLDHGLTAKMIKTRLRSRRLVPRYPGVYAVGHAALTHRGHWLAAVMACGATATLSHASAAAAWGLRAPPNGRIDVSIAGRSGRGAGDGIRIHRPRHLPADEVTVLDRIPITSWARTLLDLAPVVRGKRMEALIAQADRLELFDLVELRRVLAAHPTRPGSPSLAALLDDLRGDGPADTRSPGEVALLQLCADFGLPLPRANVWIGPYLVDFHWPGTSLVVEADGSRGVGRLGVRSGTPGGPHRSDGLA